MKRVVAQTFPINPSLRAPMDLGIALRAARTSAGLSLDAAALGLGISKKTLLKLEQGASSVAIGTALHAAAQLGVALFMVPAARKDLARRKILSEA
jgi:transcriptional regulator with XRE-family HTH domain